MIQLKDVSDFIESAISMNESFLVQRTKLNIDEIEVESKGTIALLSVFKYLKEKEQYNVDKYCFDNEFLETVIKHLDRCLLALNKLVLAEEEILSLNKAIINLCKNSILVK